MTDYTSVKVPKRITEMILECKEFHELGYRTISEFVLDATRRNLERLQQKELSNKENK